MIDQDELPFEPPVMRSAPLVRSTPRMTSRTSVAGTPMGEFRGQQEHGLEERTLRMNEEKPGIPRRVSADNRERRGLLERPSTLAPKAGEDSQPRNIPDLPTETQQESNEPWHERLVQKFFAVPPPVDPLKKNGRLYTALAFFLLAFMLVIGKLFKIQVVDHASFSRAADDQYKMEMPLAPKRGLIRDRNGVILAANAYVVKYAIDPKALQHKEKLAELFSQTFGKPVKTYLSVFNDTTRRYIVVEKEVPLEVAARLDSVKDHGLIRSLDSRRNYAFSERASHLLGFASKDGRGLAGIELISNHELGGHPGFQVMQKDGHGGRRPDVDYEKVPAIDGDNLTLTIDESIQSISEAALKAGVETAKAEAGIVIVMRPKTGEILALANVPDFDPNHFYSATNEMLRNRAITDAYEPGSTIKVLTAAAALEDGAWKPEDKIDAEHGHWNPENGVKITDTHPYGVITFRQALEKSSNICFAKISDRLNQRRFYKYLRDFGIGNFTGIDLPGEVKGVLHTPVRWQANSKRYMAFGYELTATPIQMATAYATVANFGLMMKPYIIAKREGIDEKETKIEPQEIRRVVSEQTCKTLISIMEGVVDSGTATLARIKGVRIAGKTGTAQQLVGGHWSKEHYTSSFTGFFPAEKPEYLISVILRSPHNGYYGGTVSGPIFREIAMRILDRDAKLPVEARTKEIIAPPTVSEGVVDIDGTPLTTKEESDRSIGDVRGLSVEAGRALLASQGFTVMGAKDQPGVIDKVQKCGGDTVRFIVAKPIQQSDDDRSKEPSVPLVAPDLVGMPIARAIKFASASGLRVTASGTGNVTRQSPEAGAALVITPAGSPSIMLFGEEH